MLKRSVVLFLACLAFVLMGCATDPVNWRAVESAHSEANFKIIVSVPVSDHSDPVIYMYAEELQYDQEAGRLLVRNAYLSTDSDSHTNAIFIKEATFEFKFLIEVKITKLKLAKATQ